MSIDLSKPFLFLLVLLGLLGLTACDDDEGPDAVCTPMAYKMCVDGVSSWFDSCMAAGEVIETCECGCLPDATACALCGDTCEEGTCSGQGTCDDSSGTPTCTCNDGYTGVRCQSCADGYELVGGVCQSESTTVCEVDTCNGHGTCDDSSGAPVCTCEEGFTGTFCAQSELYRGLLKLDTADWTAVEGEFEFPIKSYAVMASFFQLEAPPEARTQYGPCTMPPASWPKYVDRFGAGTLTISGGVRELTMNPQPNPEGPGVEYPSVHESETLWSGGESLSITATGQDDGVPAFSTSIIGASPVEATGYDGQPWPAITERVNLEPSLAHTFEWTGGAAGEEVVITLRGDVYYEIECRFPAEAGSGTVPVELFQAINQPLSDFFIESQNTTTVGAGDFTIEVVTTFQGESNQHRISVPAP
ncbi:MAG: calcium-binding EGF-like domain-containing protein [Myxococcota bacterium]|jgi:hypothetical protein|nr:calcium-binding EGF-like domain-containing protein [Myxococcota bacterium]